MPTPSTTVRPADPMLAPALRLAAIFALVKLLLQFALTLYTTHIGYSYFRDEFYYIACGRHLAWGYVDHGPIVAVQARLGEILFGDSLFAIRILSAVAGAIMIFLGGLLTWALGGRRSAQVLAMFALLLTPCYIAVDGFLSMNSCESIFWMTTILGLIMLARGGSPRLWWTVIGFSSGIGLLNKPSITFFLICLAIALLCTPQRRILFSPWAAFGIALMIVIELPNVFWQIHNHWATLEFLHEVSHGKNDALNPLAFFGAQLLQLHPLMAIVWITGILSLLRAKTIRDMRWIAIAYLVFLPIMWHFHAKDYYLAPFYPVLYAAGACAWEHRYANSPERSSRLFAFPILETALLILVGLALPMASPILRPEPWVRYTTAMHFRHDDGEREKGGALPQFYADRFGWDEFVSKTVAAYNSLSPADRAQACIATGNYGEAAAIDFFNDRDHLGLPPATSGHNNYWIWGDQGCTRKVVIAITNGTPADFTYYQSAVVVGHIDNPLIMPYEHRNIILLHNRKEPLDWKGEKHFD